MSDSSTSSWADWLMRVAGLVRKESLQIRRDPSSYVIAGFLPLLLLFIFGYGVSLDLKRVPVAVVVESPTPEANSLAASFGDSRFFEVRLTRSRHEVEEDLVAGRIHGLIVLAADFADRLGRHDTAPVQVIVDGSDPNTALLVLNYAQGVWSNWLGQEAWTQNDLVGRAGITLPVSVEPRVWFNPEIRSQNALIPGSTGIILTLIGTLLTALVVAREWERGTIEAIMATPIGVSEFLLGKIIPYFVLGMVAMLVSVAAATLVFKVPFRGSIPALLVVSATFLCTMLALGLIISTLTKNQFAASQAALITGFLPAFELSGFIFEIDSMPLPIRLMTYVLPARYFVADLQTLFLAGDVWGILLPNTLVLAFMGIVLLTVLVRLTRLRLE